MGSKIRVTDLSKVFAASERSVATALERLRAREDRELIKKELGAVAAVSEVSFDVREGEIFIIMGLSGSGKSTLVRCINRLIEPSSGSIRIDDEEILTMNPQELRELRRSRMAMVFQNFALLPHRTVLENVEFGLLLRGVSHKEREQRALDSLQLVGLEGWERHYPDSLSGGMRQRVGLARALASDPEILIMDEPFSALDPLIRTEMQNELLSLEKNLKKTIVFITHDIQEAVVLGDRVAIMRDGKIEQIGTPEELVERPANDYVAQFTRELDRGRIITVGRIARKPKTKIDAETTISASRKLTNGSRYTFVVNSEKKPVGYLDAYRMPVGDNPGARSVSNIMSKDFDCVDKALPLSGIYDKVRDGVPIAVVDDSGAIVGYLDAADIVKGLAAEANGTRNAAPDQVSYATKGQKSRA